MIKTGERRLPAPSEKVQFPGMAAGWRHGPPQALPESPREGPQLVPGLLCLAFCGGSGKPPLEGHSVLVFSAAGNWAGFTFLPIQQAFPELSRQSRLCLANPGACRTALAPGSSQST